MTTFLQDNHWPWLEEEVDRHYLKFTTKKNINIFIGTWNVNAKEPKDDIKSWLIDPHIKFKPHLYVLGFQEIVDLNAANLWMEHTANERWEKQIEHTLKQSIPSQYIQIASRHLVGILLCIYARASLKTHIKNVMTSIVGVGLFGTAGNKGGVGIRMQIYDSDICFICSHLAAHKNNVLGRNQDYLKIIENMKFSASSTEDELLSVNEYHFDEEQKDDEEELLSIIPHHDIIFWFGDLNYRLNFDDLEYVFDKIFEKDWYYLLSQDQLNIERIKQRAFGNFVEADITFDPTYKFQPGTSIYEQRTDKKKRFPAWCDRVLWCKGTKKTTNIKDVKCLKYSVSMQQNMSDHKPVYAWISYATNRFNIAKRNEMKREIIKNKDKNDNNKLPVIEIEPEVSFPLIKFGETEQRMFVIHNTGMVSVSFRFTHAEHIKGALSKWLKITPNNGVVSPQDKACIIFEICVTSDAVKTIGVPYKLEETVLLRIENTSDKVVPIKFVVVTAKYLVSCFGNKIENLIKYKKPIRYIDNEKKIKSNGVSQENTLSIPKELWRLIDHLYKYGMDTESIFVQRGISTEISDIRECLDTGKVFSRYESHSVGEALVRFLESLQDAVFPASIYETYDDKDKECDITEWCRGALMMLPLSHYNTFVYIISFLRQVLKHSPRNKLTPEILAYQFSSALMQTSVKGIDDLSNFKPFKILRYCLTTDDMFS